MTVGSSVVVLLGLAVGLLGPRIARPLLAALSAVLAMLVVVWRAGTSQWSFLAAGVAVVLLTAVVVWLVARWPRVGLLPALLVALLLGMAPILFDAGSRLSVPFRLLAVVCIALAVWGLICPLLGVRLAAAAIGARLVLSALPGEAAAWQWPALACFLFLLGRLVSARAELKRGVRRLYLGAAAASALVAFLCVGAAVLFAKELPAPDARGAPRLQRLRAVAPSGGYLWPALSESITWEGGEAYPAWDNLNVRYLTGSAERGLFRLPHSSRLLGRFSLNREVEAMRALKDAEELVDLEAAAQAIVTAVKETAPGRTPGLSERALAASIHRLGLAAGCSEDSFPPIVASGARAAAPHAFPTDAPLREGELVVVDVGCSVHHYASDFTRTFPVGGHFTPEYRRDYEAVYAAQQAALAACRPGAVLSGKSQGGEPSLDAIAHRVLKERLGESAYRHALGHGVGLFVHDVGTGGPLQPGVVLTLEPGLYLAGKVGIRIEDTYRVTESGCVPLTTGLPADPDAVEAFLAGRSP
jgi:Metallopeptidase family M24